MLEQDPSAALVYIKPPNIQTLWIKIIAQPGLNLVVHSVAVVPGCITGGWERFRGEIHRPESFLAAEPSCSLKVKAMSRLTAVQNVQRGLTMLVNIIMHLIWCQECNGMIFEFVIFAYCHHNSYTILSGHSAASCESV